MTDNNRRWNWAPELPLTTAVPVFIWPFKLKTCLKYLGSVGFIGSAVVPYLVLALISWHLLQPSMSAEIDLLWIFKIFGRNFLLIFLVAGAFHLYFYVFKVQGNQLKFEKRDLQKNNKKFFMNDQVKDNMFWTLGSGVVIWTAYEVLYLWAVQNDFLPYYMQWRNHPVSFGLMFLAIPFISSLHFHLVHRLLHWPPIYKVAHSVHHRNVTLGPWSGFSMHPIEHIIYMSSVLIHFIIPSHPLHVLYHNIWNAVGASITHTGYEALTLRGKPVLYLTSFFHQIHHRYLDCNYGNSLVPADNWFGCENDGTEESMKKMERRRAG
jgi:lathosterol oxidase